MVSILIISSTPTDFDLKSFGTMRWPKHDIWVVLEHLTKHPVSLHDESGQQEDNKWGLIKSRIRVLQSTVAQKTVPMFGCFAKIDAA